MLTLDFFWTEHNLSIWISVSLSLETFNIELSFLKSSVIRELPELFETC